jgi:hypothetical protein
LLITSNKNHAQRSEAFDCIFAKRAFEVSRGEVEEPMTLPENRAVSVLLTEEHLRKMIEDHLLQANEISDRVKVARIVQKLVDTGLGLPDRPWHDWDEWGKGLA